MSMPEGPSLTPPHIPPPTLKRPRQSNGAAVNGLGRHKRRKPEDSVGPDSGTDKKGAINFGVGMVKGREDEFGESQEVVTRVDFNDLPDDCLYRYLEVYDLVPRWDVSPWSEKPCTPPNALYTLTPAPAAIPINPSPPKPSPVNTPTVPSTILPDVQADLSMSVDLPPTSGLTDAVEDVPNSVVADAIEPEPEPDLPAPPTTRSKTLPSRRPPTPSPEPQVVKRGVMTLSDVHAARGALAERANAHWAKGLGGGQNKEGETIVNFLYKNRVGHGRLLRVYNPMREGL
ncbi:hypothetical protein TREMEDRAFT_64532 [Tremella mesenterica DSM 1558]|uniref:uncharacterized protein n=1 Tax=Tremella mesenterica (strain ATCC 24925 / CBS 8224 / DSM 1558 / NBRC 9311 / NRRL Y-6157 / RJB 2259-6 / UBC 559-6) TaxID=578456 RepID=UPI0003F49D7F|nr:uncharacterized protein TREMEDRAFT_64532 [Tremella mesenterica DSM 1558]EIW67283.1 hypothetical protein TREMEDRAFT_64532 [Tremella mesenterica DSM 1558]